MNNARMGAADPEGDGYANPVVFQDLSDPDAIRVGDEWYLVSSSFCNVPGLPVYRSRNLVDWTLIAYALDRLEPEGHYGHPRPGCGVWAPAIRRYNGVFSIWYPDPDFGIFKVSAKDPAGPWGKPELVQASSGSIDPCPFIDDDGSRWLVKAWAKSRAGFNNRISLIALDEHDRAIDEGITIIDGSAFPNARTSAGEKPWVTIEGPKLYKRDGWYYILAPAGGVAIGWQAAFRARKLQGPWECRNVMDQGSSAVNGPHQGAWVDAPDGSDWFLHFQDRDAWGRILHLQPMAWKDGWPLIGADSGDGTLGEPVSSYRLPVSGTEPDPKAQKKVETRMGWQWSANPAPEWIEHTAGGFRLACVAEPQNPWEAGAVYSRQITGPRFSIQARIAFSPLHEGERAGLSILGYHCRWVGLCREGPGISLVVEDFAAAETDRKAFARQVILEMTGPVAWFRAVIVDAMAEDGTTQTVARTEWSLDGAEWAPAGEDFVARPGRWIGTRVGFMATAPFGTFASTAPRNGSALVDHISY